MQIQLERRQEIVLAALASQPGADYAPVQVQKLFFLLDENIADEFGGRQFNFEPYDYGPFDKTVYHELEALGRFGLLNIIPVGPGMGRRRYVLTPQGQEAGDRVLANLPERAKNYTADVSRWVRSLSFAQLVGSIYKAYPNMRENSVFQG